MVDNSAFAASRSPEPSGPEGEPTSVSPEAAELAKARERLDFYESFDTLIQENVRRSGDLLRQMADERERAQRQIEDMRAEVDARLAEQRTMLAEIAASLGELERSLGSISSRVNSSLSRLSGPAGVTSSAELAPGIANPSESVAELAPDDPAPPSTPGAERLDSGRAVAFLEPATGTATGVDALARLDERPVSPMPEQAEIEAVERAAANGEPAVRAPATTASRRIDLVIHGVPNAATALAIQRYLQDLPAVHAVEVREYVSGVLRFQVVAQELSAADLARWEGGDGVEALNSRDNVLELRLPTAEGL